MDGSEACIGLESDEFKNKGLTPSLTPSPDEFKNKGLTPSPVGFLGDSAA